MLRTGFVCMFVWVVINHSIRCARAFDLPEQIKSAHTLCNMPIEHGLSICTPSHPATDKKRNSRVCPKPKIQHHTNGIMGAVWCVAPMSFRSHNNCLQSVRARDKRAAGWFSAIVSDARAERTQTFRQPLDAIEAALDLRPQRIQIVRRGQPVVNTSRLTPVVRRGKEVEYRKYVSKSGTWGLKVATMEAMDISVILLSFNLCNQLFSFQRYVYLLDANW